MPLSFLIQTSRDQRSFASFPGLIAGYHVFRRLSMPRHPPCTLSSLTTVTDHRHSPIRDRKVPYTRPTTDQIILCAGFVLPPRCCRNDRTIPLAKKVLDDPLAENGKDLAPTGRAGT